MQPSRKMIGVLIACAAVLLIGASQARPGTRLSLAVLSDGRLIVSNDATGEICRLPTGDWTLDEERLRAMAAALNEDSRISPGDVRASAWRAGYGIECIDGAIWPSR